MRVLRRGLLLGVMALIGSWHASAFGQTVIWEGGAGPWFAPAGQLPNWSCLCDPNGGGFSVNIGTGTGIGAITGTVTLNMPASVAGVSLGNGAFGELDVSLGNTLTASNAVIVGASDAGTLNINTGGVVNDVNGAMGSLSGATGNATVSGSGSQWNNSNDLSVGLNGSGTLTIDGGGHVSGLNGFIGANSGSTGAVMVSGTGSQLTSSGYLEIGDFGSGALVIRNGGVVSSGRSYVGLDSGSSGSAMVTGASSRWDTNLLAVGDVGHGSLTIENGAVVNSIGSGAVGAYTATGVATVSGTGTQWNISGELDIGTLSQGNSLTLSDGAIGTSAEGIDITLNSGATGTLSLTGAGTTWTNTDSGQYKNPVLVGDAGTGTLTIQNGAVLSSPSLSVLGGASGVIGNQANSHGGAEVMTGGKWSNAANLLVGNAGNGVLLIRSGGIVTDTIGVVGASGGSSGTVLVTGARSAWNNSGNLDIGVNGTGKLTVKNGGLVAAGTLANPGTITIGTHGTVDAKGGTLQGNIVNHGTLDPLGTANIVGNYTQNSDGTLALDVAGTGPGQFGQLDVSGNALFGGTIIFDFIDGFAPQQGQSFDFINVMGTGDFSGATIDISGLRPGFQYADRFSGGAFTLTALNNGVSENTVPEPGTLLLLAAGLVGVALCVRKRRRLAATL